MKLLGLMHLFSSLQAFAVDRAFTTIYTFQRIASLDFHRS